ncbi:hypothetical protein PanWU01x14_233600 [Parasponia andersonii]|uniref:Transmembrane protein n=1 Tax=Parasponia andersonii TaxID=3476 RepID=A0A2P5BJJ3_PARAD|nr:hypothetical protein PanWU01x14_233600 [Parasponia andersonii]
MANFQAIGLKILFTALGFAALVTLVYTVTVDPFRSQTVSLWFAATLVDFYINVVVLAAWVVYKESNWFSAILWIILLAAFGSIITCTYIVMQLFKLSPRESAEDPIYHILLQNSSKNNFEQKGKNSSVVTARVIFSALGCLMLGTLLYTLLTDGSPFRKELLVP